jgi:hypothetical protein
MRITEPFVLACGDPVLTRQLADAQITHYGAARKDHTAHESPSN